MNTPLAALFPLPLSTIEALFLAEDRDTHPATFAVQAAISGTIDETAFRTALRKALTRHPLLQALVTRSAPRQCWRYAPEQQPWLDYGAADKPLCYPVTERMDLRSEPGLRVWVRQGSGAAGLTMQFHHSCCDGIGASQLMADLLALYDQLLDSSSPAGLLELDPRRLPFRDRVMRSYFKPDLQGISSVLAETYNNFLAQRPTPLHPPTGAAPERESLQQVSPTASYTFEEHEYRQLRRVAQKHGAALNDLLARDLFRTLYAWNDQQKPGDPGKWFRITVPVNMRGLGDAVMPAANLMSLYWLNQPAKDCVADRSGPLLQAIRRQTRASRLRRLGSQWLVAVAALRAAGVLPLLQAAPACFATVVLTNLGDPTRRVTALLPRSGGRLRCGGLVVEELVGSTPLRPYTRAAFVVNAYAGRLTLAARADPHLFSPESTRRLLMLYVKHLRESGDLPA